MPKILDRPDLQTVARHFADACAASRQHSAVAASALEQYGDHGPQISGCVRDHFPEHVKDELRRLAHACAAAGDAAWAARPSRIQWHTMTCLSRAVAQRDGSGFYGPQP
jgi:hypothetical protein